VEGSMRGAKRWREGGWAAYLRGITREYAVWLFWG